MSYRDWLAGSCNHFALDAVFLYGGMPLICQPSQRGLEPGTHHTRSQRRKHVFTMDRPLSTKASQRDNAAYVHTVNVVLPEKPHSTHLVTPGKGDETTSKDRSQLIENPNAEISAVPDPVPNPLIPAVPSFTAEQTGRPFEMPKTITGGASSVFSTRLIAVPNSLLSLSFSASVLSNTLSLTPTPPTSTSRSAENPVGTFNKAPPQQATRHQLSTTIITLLTFGGAFLVIAILIGVKLWIQPRRRSHPTPSLPILQDAFPPARKVGDESPLFGGKERLSSQTANGGVPWTWTQYQSGIPKPVPAAASVSKPAETDQAPIRYSCGEAPHVTHMAGIPGIPGTGKHYESNSYPSKALSRLSTLSGLVHPGPMYEGAGQENIGIAVGYGQGLESGGTESVARSVNKRGSTRNAEKRRSTIYGSPEGLAYTMSPSLAPVADGGDEYQGDGFLRQGRAPVKAPYGAGSYFRGSASSTENVEMIGHPVTGDKPPRVPSPPILPSLAQMADYRSPTYSLYGLYSS